MSERTAEEALEDDLSRLGPRLGPVFHGLWNDIAWLHIKWREYREMFGATPERIELLNSAARLFFGIVQDMLWEDTLLHLSRLTDPPKSKGRLNLTVQALPGQIGDQLLRDEVSGLVVRAVEATKFARDWRNRRISHRDLDLALNNGAKPLAPASRKEVSEAVSAVHEVLNRISERLLQRTLADDVISRGGDAVELMFVIRDGLEAGEAREERLRKGQLLPGDLGPRAV